MGQMCPICKTHQAQIKVFTSTLDPAWSAADVVAVELACHHKVGNEEYMEYQKLALKIKMAAEEQIIALREKTTSELGAAWEKVRGKDKK